MTGLLRVVFRLGYAAGYFKGYTGRSKGYYWTGWDDQQLATHMREHQP